MELKSIMLGNNILVISPHPDDEAICCGGLIMLAKQKQINVHVVYVAIGSSRQFLTGKTNAKERLPEIKKASAFGGFNYSIAFNGKQFMRLDSIPQKIIIEKIEDVIQNIKPNIVCIPFRHSFDQDHRAISTACITALRPLPNQLHHQPKIILECEEPYAWTTQDLFKPTFYVDISSVFDQKIELLNMHASQLRKDPFPRSPENLRRLAGMRGCEIGVKYAEAYNLLKGQFL